MITRYRHWLMALSAAVVLSLGMVFALSGPVSSAPRTPAIACDFPAWAEGNTYPAGTKVTYNGRGYVATVTHTASPGTNWNPAATPSLWQDLGACDSTPPPPPTSPPPTSPPPTSPPPTASCPVKSRPAGQGAAGLLGELGRRRQRRPLRRSAGSRSPIPHRRARLQRHQRRLPGDPLRRHGPVAGRHGRDGEGRHPGRDVPGQGGRADDPDVDRRRRRRHRPQLQHRRRPVRGDRRADLEGVQLRRHRHRHRDRPHRQRQHQQLSTSQANLVRIIDGVLAQMPPASA